MKRHSFFLKGQYKAHLIGKRTLLTASSMLFQISPSPRPGLFLLTKHASHLPRQIGRHWTYKMPTSLPPAGSHSAMVLSLFGMPHKTQPFLTKKAACMQKQAKKKIVRFGAGWSPTQTIHLSLDINQGFAIYQQENKSTTTAITTSSALPNMLR